MIDDPEFLLPLPDSIGTSLAITGKYTGPDILRLLALSFITCTFR
jgi:hypothetical protein